MSLVVIGLDPGYITTGYGVVATDGRKSAYVDSGILRLPTRGDLPARLHHLCRHFQNLLSAHRPAAVAVESAFVHRNAASALKLAHVRGAVIGAAAMNRARVAEYTPTAIKKTLTGNGRAEKHQVEYMVRQHLPDLGDRELTPDAADALAAALCWAYSDEMRLARQRLG